MLLFYLITPKYYIILPSVMNDQNKQYTMLETDKAIPNDEIMPTPSSHSCPPKTLVVQIPSFEDKGSIRKERKGAGAGVEKNNRRLLRRRRARVSVRLTGTGGKGKDRWKSTRVANLAPSESR